MESPDPDPNIQQDDVQPISNEQAERNRELYHLVFGIDLLREIIIDNVIHEGGKLSQANALSCRQVQRSWNESVSKCLSRTGEPLFQFNFTAEADMAPQSLTSQFLNSYTSPSRMFESIPPFALTVTFGNGIPTESSKEVLEKCFRLCAKGLVVLEFHFSSYDVKALELPEDLSLPVLHNLNLSFADSPRSIREDVLQTSGIPAILAASRKLKYFTVQGFMKIPVPCTTLCLPETITNVELRQGLTFDHLEQLVRSNGDTFPKLTSLLLNIPNASYNGKDSIFQILERVCHTLKTLHLEGGGFGPEEDWVKTPLHFPPMKSLETCIIDANNWNWGENAVVHLERMLPILKKINLSHLTPTMLRHLMESCRMESAKELSIFLIRDEAHNTDEDLPPAIVKLPQAFPNITVLDISLLVAMNAPNLFHPIFCNMPQLEDLTLLLFQFSDFDNPDEFWSTMFLGMSPDAITATTPAYVTKMSELRVLKLNLAMGFPTVFPDPMFELGFLRMPKLLDLRLLGNFKASPAMVERWSEAGRNAIRFEEELGDLEESSDESE